MRKLLANTPLSNIDRLVGLRVLQLRQRHRLTHSRLARYLEISSSNYEAYELGTKRVPARHLHELVHLFGEPTSFFFQDLT